VTIQFSADDIERAKRIEQNPFDSDVVRLYAHDEPVATDDGLFKHRDDYVTCFGCEPCPATGEPARPHLHLVLEGANGGVRCAPLCITTIAEACLARWGADAVGLLVQCGALFHDDAE
jgi:hypothetical protein